MLCDRSKLFTKLLPGADTHAHTHTLSRGYEQKTLNTRLKSASPFFEMDADKLSRPTLQNCISFFFPMSTHTLTHSAPNSLFSLLLSRPWDGVSKNKIEKRKLGIKGRKKGNNKKCKKGNRGWGNEFLNGWGGGWKTFTESVFQSIIFATVPHPPAKNGRNLVRFCCTATNV